MLIHCKQLNFSSELPSRCRQFNFSSKSQSHYRTNNSAANYKFAIENTISKHTIRQTTQFQQQITNFLQTIQLQQGIKTCCSTHNSAVNANSLQTTQFRQRIKIFLQTIQLRQWIANSLQNTQFGNECYFAVENSVSVANQKFTADNSPSAANHKFGADNSVSATNHNSSADNIPSVVNCKVAVEHTIQ
jgi:hypothetical protein